MKKFKYTINGHDYEVTVNNVGETVADVEVNGEAYKVQIEPTEKKPAIKIRRAAEAPTTAGGDPVVSRPAAAPAGQGSIKTPLPGIIVKINCKVGDVVKRGQNLLVLEAMKMENNISADRDGTVSAIRVNEGDSVMEGDDLIILE